MLQVFSYTIYHSPNAYLGIRLAEDALRDLAVEHIRRPIAIPRDRGVKVAELVGGTEPPRRGAATREDCSRWAARYGIEIRYPAPGEFERRVAKWARSSMAREELPARAYYAAVGTGKEAALDRGLFEAAWIHGHDVNDEATVSAAAAAAGLRPDDLLERAMRPEIAAQVDAALADFAALECPGVPTFVINGERYWGKDRIDWLVERIHTLAALHAETTEA